MHLRGVERHCHGAAGRVPVVDRGLFPEQREQLLGALWAVLLTPDAVPRLPPLGVRRAPTPRTPETSRPPLWCKERGRASPWAERTQRGREDLTVAQYQVQVTANCG